MTREGTGKTYASAFAVRHMNPKKVLFLVHREQVAKDARKIYLNVFGGEIDAGVVSGSSKDYDSDFVFSTVQTMSKDYSLEHYDKNHFDVIVVDEVHHAGADSYKKILDYFNPKFCLGMTATPERSDEFDIYELFDDNIAYEIRLQQALEEDLLCPFHYFGITDIEIDGKRIDDNTSFNSLVDEARVEHIINKTELFGYSGKRVKGLIFCRNVKEAEALSAKLNEHGYRTLALSGANSQQERIDAVERLTCNEDSSLYNDRLDYILTVDIFNEGVDIPDVNQIVMLRPTESAIVFVQQLGRGLRKADKKEFVVILDFIGNYNNSYLIPLALTGDRSYNKDSMRMDVMEGAKTLPGCSTIHFDEVARKQIFESIDNSKIDLRFMVKRYTALKNKLNRIPTMMDFVEFGEIDPMLICENKKSYYRFLEAKEPGWDKLLTNVEQDAIQVLTKWVGYGKRPHELLVLQAIEDGKIVDFNLFYEMLLDYGIKTDEKAYGASMRVLTGEFFNDKVTFSFIENCEKGYTATREFSALLDSSNFTYAYHDVIAYALNRYETKYKGAYRGFKRYETYKRREICQMLNWRKNMSGGMISGYPQFKGENECPIFITYEKSDDISDALDYKDHFINQNIFAWQSAHNAGPMNKQVNRILNSKNNGMRLLLFIKKSDSVNATDFYYIGDVTPEKWSESTIEYDGKKEPITNILFSLDKPVQDDVYDYLVS